MSDQSEIPNVNELVSRGVFTTETAIAGRDAAAYEKARKSFLDALMKLDAPTRAEAINLTNKITQDQIDAGAQVPTVYLRYLGGDLGIFAIARGARAALDRNFHERMELKRLKQVEELKKNCTCLRRNLRDNNDS